ncbi:MAG TPA: XdhC family protein [Marmoricola sp.]|nr:XdhC family protein [Marmoricola sp.]
MGERRLLVVGDGPVAEALVPMAELLGWAAATATTLPEVEAALPGCTAVVVTSHDEDVDAVAIARALAEGPAYLGGMGSRRTQARRRQWLLDHGITEAQLAGVRGPAGLDIGADSPPEIALSILAELTATVRGAVVVGSISDREGPIHPDLPPGTAFCPTG